MTDQDHARQVKAVIEQLNHTIQAAHQSGLDVEVVAMVKENRDGIDLYQVYLHRMFRSVLKD